MARTRRPKDFDYQTYLASREWGVLREQVRQRSGNQCEHCYHAPQQAVHHLTYERIGQEKLGDLLAVCNPCHEFLSGKPGVDNPQSEWLVVTPVFMAEYWARTGGAGEHYLIPLDEGRVEWHMCKGAGCIWCGYADLDWPIFMNHLYKRPFK